MKRLTDTNKWDDPWFQPLSPTAKLLFLYLLDHCDIAGVVRPNLQLAAFQIGQSVEEKHIIELGDRVKLLAPGKYLLPKFVAFQFGKLSETSLVHRSVIKAIQSHNLTDSIPCPSHTQGISHIPNQIPHQISPKTKEKEKEKEKGTGTEGVQGENGNGFQVDPVFTVLKDRLNRMWNRDPKVSWEYPEDYALAAIARRPDAVFELGEIQKFRDAIAPDDVRFSGLPKSLPKLLDGWSGALDVVRASVTAKKNSDDDRVPLDEKPRKRSTERMPYVGFPAGFGVDDPPKREYFRDDRAFETCHILFEQWCEWRKRELAKQQPKVTT